MALTGDELDEFHPGLVKGELVIYCSCPDEVSSAGAAIRLKRGGFKKIRPLKGGFPLWTNLGFPVDVPEAQRAMTWNR